MADDFYDGKFVSKLVGDPLMLRLILEALIVDDLDKKRKTLNLAEVMSEIQDNPEAVIQKANEEADHLLRLLKAIRLTCFAFFSVFIRSLSIVSLHIETWGYNKSKIEFWFNN